MRHIFKTGKMLLTLAIVAVALTVGGCASSSVSTAESSSGIRAAEEVGAANVPQASLYLQMAKEELELSEGLSAKGDRDEAKSMLLRANADAELAIALSHEDAEKVEAQSALKRVHKLLQDNQ